MMIFNELCLSLKLLVVISINRYTISLLYDSRFHWIEKSLGRCYWRDDVSNEMR